MEKLKYSYLKKGAYPKEARFQAERLESKRLRELGAKTARSINYICCSFLHESHFVQLQN